MRALLVIDMLKDFLEEGKPPTGWEKSIGSVKI